MSKFDKIKISINLEKDGLHFHLKDNKFDVDNTVLIYILVSVFEINYESSEWRRSRISRRAQHRKEVGCSSRRVFEYLDRETPVYVTTNSWSFLYNCLACMPRLAIGAFIN